MSLDELERPGEGASARKATGDGPAPDPVESPATESDESDASPWSPLLAAVVAAAILVYVVLNWPAVWDPWSEIVTALFG